MFPCTLLVYSLGALCSFFIYILLFTDKKKRYGRKEAGEMTNSKLLLLWMMLPGM